MKSPIPFYLNQIMDQVRPNTEGAVADYIPELAHANPDCLGVALATNMGRLYTAGDAEVRFTIQSISKPFVFALALQELGLPAVKKVVSLEPSGEAFNELSLHKDDNRPMNPLINAGAIAVNQLINGVDSSVEDRVERVREFMSRLAGRDLEPDAKVNDSEMAHADRNFALAHMLRSHGIIQDDARDAVYTYTQQCSLSVDVRDLAVMSATLSNGGVQPVTGERILDADVCRLTLAVMSSCGMYNGAGRWMAEVGIPAKSGVSGGLLGTLPGQLGVATYSPRLNKEGNSVRGVDAFKAFSQGMGLHLMSTDNRFGAHPIREVETDGRRAVVRLQGHINFTAAEAILAALEELDLQCEQVLIDISQVSGLHKVGRKMIKEGLRRFREEGRDIGMLDPEDTMEDRKMADGTDVPMKDAEDVTINGEVFSVE